MTDDVRVHAVEPFFTTHGLAEATGLGLSAAHGFALQSGGRLTLHGDPGRGTTVRLRFPRITDSEPQPAPSEAPRVLLVEDEPAVRGLIREMLLRLGYQVRDTGQVDEALKLGAAFRPSILVTDVALGQPIDGVELAVRLSAGSAAMQVILISGFPMDRFDLSRLPTGFQFLGKPFTLGELRTALAAAQVR